VRPPLPRCGLTGVKPPCPATAPGDRQCFAGVCCWASRPMSCAVMIPCVVPLHRPAATPGSCGQRPARRAAALHEDLQRALALCPCRSPGPACLPQLEQRQVKSQPQDNPANLCGHSTGGGQVGVDRLLRIMHDGEILSVGGATGCRLPQPKSAQPRRHPFLGSTVQANPAGVPGKPERAQARRYRPAASYAHQRSTTIRDPSDAESSVVS
jgi:hypothetical protein